jgi:hypothetical protein
MPEDPGQPAGSSAGAAAGQGYQGRAKQLLLNLQGRIAQAKENVGVLEALELKPVAEKLLVAPGAWNEGFKNTMAKRLVERHAEDQATRQLLFKLGVGAVALVAIIGTGGWALAVTAVGSGAGLAKAAIDYDEAKKLDTAAKATPLKGTELVSRAAADAKMASAQADLIMAVFDALLVAATAGAAGIAKVLEAQRTLALERLVADAPLREGLLVQVGGDKKLLIKLLGQAGDAKRLHGLLTQVTDVARLEKLLKAAGSAARLETLLGKVKDLARLEKLLDAAGDGTRLERMFERLATVEEVEAFLARQARGESQGLKEEMTLKSLAKASQGLGSRWAQLSPAQRLEEALNVVNAELDVHGVPPVRAKEMETVATRGQFDRRGWSVEIDKHLLDGEEASAQKLTSTLLHEGRHAEQVFTAARVKAGQGWTAERLALTVEEGGLGISEKVAEAATKRPLKDMASAEAKFGQKMFDAMGGKGRAAEYKKIQAKLSEAQAAYDRANYDFIDKHREALKRANHDLALADRAPEVIKARRAINQTKAARDAAFAEYKALAEEKDAHDIENAFEQASKTAPGGTSP